MYIVFAIIAFGLLILVHELGHFIAAKLSGVKVEEFSIGMGPKIFAHSIGETRYCIGVLPIGGYVQMLGETEDEEGIEINDKRSLKNKSPLIRIIVFAAGAFMNLLLAIIIFATITMNFGYKTTLVEKIIPDSPAEIAGIKVGDNITKVNGKRILTADDLNTNIAMAKGNAVKVEFESNGILKTQEIKPVEDKDGFYIIGIYNQRIKNPSFIDSVGESFKKLISMVDQTFMSLKMMVSGNINFKTDVGGPVTIIRIAGEAAKISIWSLMNLTAFLSVQLAVFNLLPIPALDGGHIFILLIEAITRKKIPTKVINTINTIGFVLLMALMAVVMLKDIIFPVSI